MAKRSGLRPRTLSIVFGLFFLIVLVGMGSFALGLKSLWYGPDLSRWVYVGYLLTGTVFVVGIGLMAMAGQRSLETRIALLEASQAHEVVPGDELGLGSAEIPPPLPEPPAGGEAVDRDIDELLLSLQEMEDTATSATEEPRLAPAFARQDSRKSARAAVSAELARLRTARKSVGRYIAGPAFASVAMVAVAGAMLPGSDGMLQSFYQLNTFFILTIAYSLGGLAAYILATGYLLLRRGS